MSNKMRHEYLHQKTEEKTGRKEEQRLDKQMTDIQMSGQMSRQTGVRFEHIYLYLHDNGDVQDGQVNDWQERRSKDAFVRQLPGFGR